jgi:hypothetical protein
MSTNNPRTAIASVRSRTAPSSRLKSREAALDQADKTTSQFMDQKADGGKFKGVRRE